MNYIDIIILVLLVAFGIGGLRKGIITEAATLLGLGLGLYGAFHFSDFTAEQLVKYVEIDQKYMNVISFAVTFIVVAVLVYLLGRLVAKLVKAINLGFVDKIGGFLIGLAKGVLISSLLIMLINALNLNGVIKEETKQKSLLYPYVEQAVPYVYEGFDLVKEAVQNATGTDENVEENTEKNTTVPVV
jgi:membrane protein required for colicin V production